VSIRSTFARLADRREMALIPYITGGFPTLPESVRLIECLADNGADLIEVGIPFSDPIADGPSIQYSSEIALGGGASLAGVLDGLGSLDLRCPVVLMSYLNPFLAYGMARLLGDCRRIGTTGLIIPDLPAEEADDWFGACRASGIDLIHLVAPTSTDARIERIVERSSGFVYCVSLAGTTGVRAELSVGLDELLPRTRRFTPLPIVVGFGISTPEHVRALYGRADGVVVGSRIIEAIREQDDLPRLIRELKAATLENTDVDCHAQ